MKRFITTAILLIPCFFIKAQQLPCDFSGTNALFTDLPQDKTQSQRPSHDEIESRKIAYLTTVVVLTSSEATRFWPVYHEWSQKLDANMRTRHAALRQIRQLDKEKCTDEKAYIRQTKILIEGAAEEARITLEAHKVYVSIIGEIKTAKLYLAEEQFRAMLIRELRQTAGTQAQNVK
ncbi:MAG: hypothetical protein FWD56_05095 [Bacteroidales bacterium]|nr:hypothetical protein [Bacteroidales bacterium]